MSRALFPLSVIGKVVGIAVFAWTNHPILAALCFVGPDPWIFYHLLVPSAQGVCRVFTRFETDRPEIWLTIDDGPDPDDTPRILDLLDRHGARATFFLIGTRVERFPTLVAEILRRGHQVGNHTQTHPAASFWHASFRRVQAELDAGTASLLAASGVRPQWFRAPAGIKNLGLGPALAARGLQCVGWSVRSYDTRSRDPAEVRDRIMRGVSPGAIVLLHEGPGVQPPVRVHALALVLDALATRGLTCVLPDPVRLR